MKKVNISQDHMVQTSHFNKENWAKLTIFEQMGNIGSEVGRALTAKHSGDEQAMRGALYRGVDLLDYTAQLWVKTSQARAREILRAKEIFVESILTDEEDPAIENYFFQYATVARKGR